MDKENNNLSHYEMLYIISNQYTEEELTPINENIEKIVKENSGKISYREDWGKKRLAYPIKQFSFGYYRLIEFDISAENVVTLERALKMTNELLRSLITAKPVLSKAQKEAEKKRQVLQTKKLKSQKEEEAKEEIESEDKKPVDLKELDEKLDKILDTDDLL